MTATTTKNTTQLVVGDVVWSNGMQLELVAGGPSVTEGVFRFDGRILNVDVVDAAGVVPAGWRVRHLPSGLIDPDFARGTYWAVQGNHLATWHVEVDERDFDGFCHVEFADDLDCGRTAGHTGEHFAG